MTPAAFIDKWSRSELRERQGAQSHFNDLCALLGEKNPSDADPTGATYCFERGATKVGGGDGWADVWKRNCFGWEYKGKHKDLNAALRQLQIYAPDLENPPYLVVCDMERIIVHTNWTNSVRRTFTFGFDDLREPATLDTLRQVFRGSDSLKPGMSPQALTALVATRFGDLGKRLQERGQDPRAVAHFLNRLIFCLFAEDAEILPKGLFTRMLRNVSFQQYNIPKKSKAQFDALFATMKDGGFFGADAIAWFNGGLFDGADALPLERDDLDMLIKTAREHDWSNIDPAILGTMFEEALKTTGRRAALGAHYTDREKILKIVDPVIIRPLAAEWELALAALKIETDAMAAADAERQSTLETAAITLSADPAAYRAGDAARRKALAAIAKKRDGAYGRATEIRDAFLTRLAAFRVLDPACGSGNFLYVALQALRDIELRAILDADRLGVPQVRPAVNLDALRGIEIEPYAAELARVTLWIGNLQWERRNGYPDSPEPVLSTLDTIECRDALLNPDGTEAEWPEADVIIGNPPFLGGKKLRAGLGDEAIGRLRAVYNGRIANDADLVCYWLEKASTIVEPGKKGGKLTSNRRSGLVATSSIRAGVNRRVLEKMANAEFLHEAWSDEPWVLEGAAVRVSMLCFGSGFAATRLNGTTVKRINANLTSTNIDITKAMRITENVDVAVRGVEPGGDFWVAGSLARSWLKSPLNPNGRPNSDVLKRSMSGRDLARRDEDIWLIDFGAMNEAEAALFEQPYSYLKISNRDNRIANTESRVSSRWWQFRRSGAEVKFALKQHFTTIVTPLVSRQRPFTKMDSRLLPDTRLIVISRGDDCSFGLLISRPHTVWTLAICKYHGVGNDPVYTPPTTFETFPFPEGLTPNIPAADYADDPRAQKIATAAETLNRLREAWLNPPDLVRIEPEVVPGYPDRILPKDEAAAAVLKKRTLTNLYNERPTWLANAHRILDEAVAAAYGWPTDLTDDEILARLFALNQERAAAGR